MTDTNPDKIGLLRNLALLGGAPLLLSGLFGKRTVRTYEDALEHPDVVPLAGKVGRLGAKVRSIHHQVRAVTEELDAARRNPDYSLDEVADLLSQMDALEVPYQQAAEPFMVAYREFSSRLQAVCREAAEAARQKPNSPPLAAIGTTEQPE